MTFRLRNYIFLSILVFTFLGCTPSSNIDQQPPTTMIPATSTPFPTVTNLHSTITPSVTPFPSPTNTSTPLITPLILTQGITFVFMGETIPDGTNFQPGQTSKRHGHLKMLVPVPGAMALLW